MEMTDSMAVSVTALDAQRHRLNVISSNLANAQSTHTPGGGPYKRRDVVFQSTPVARDRKSTRLNSSHLRLSRMPSSA